MKLLKAFGLASILFGGLITGFSAILYFLTWYWDWVYTFELTLWVELALGMAPMMVLLLLMFTGLIYNDLKKK